MGMAAEWAVTCALLAAAGLIILFLGGLVGCALAANLIRGRSGV